MLFSKDDIITALGKLALQGRLATEGGTLVSSCEADLVFKVCLELRIWQGDVDLERPLWNALRFVHKHPYPGVEHFTNKDKVANEEQRKY